MPRPRFRHRLAHLALGALVFAACPGCGNSDSAQAVPETDEKKFHDAQTMLREDRSEDALADYLAVIKTHQDDAPESHLEAGRLFLQFKKDPVAAIYHFQKYLEAKPNSEQAPMVRQLIDTAKKDFARTLPGQPYAGDYDRIELLDQIKTLQAENENLKRQTGFTPPSRVSGATLESFPTNPNTSRVALMATTPSLSQPSAPAPTQAHATVAAAPPPRAATAPVAVTAVTPITSKPAVTPISKPAAGAHTYTVQAGDTLSAISMKLYGTRSRRQDIYNANRDHLSSPNAIHPGQVLVIP